MDAEPRLDAAVLDVNLLFSSAYPLADRLKAEGVPFIFAMGHARADIPARFADVPHCEKPVTVDCVIQMVRQSIDQP